MINPNYVFELEPDTTIDTIGGTITANRLVGKQYKKSGHFHGDGPEPEDETPTYLVKNSNSWYTVRRCDVEQIIKIDEIEA